MLWVASSATWAIAGFQLSTRSTSRARHSTFCAAQRQSMHSMVGE
jgi:hypothetical protein